MTASDHEASELLRRNARDVFVSQLSLQVVRSVYVLVIARLLGLEDYGIQAYAHSIPLSVLPVIGAGLGPIMLREIAQRRDDARHRANVALTMIVVACLACAVGLTAFTLLTQPALALLVFLFSLGVAAQGIQNWVVALATGFERPAHPIRLAVRTRWLEAVVGIPLLIAGAGMYGVAIAYVFSNALLAWRALRFAHAELQPIRLAFARAEVRSLATEGAKVAVLTLLSSLVTRGPLIVLGLCAAPGAVLGHVGLLLQLAVIGSTVLAPTISVMAPAFARSAIRTDASEGIMIARALRLLALGGAAGALVLDMIGRLALGPLIGDSYTPAGPWLWVAAIVAAMGGMCFVALQSLMARARYRWLFVTDPIVVAVSCTIPGLDPSLTGAATGMLVSLSTWALLRFALSAHVVKASVLRWLAAPVGLLGSVIAALVVVPVGASWGVAAVLIALAAWSVIRQRRADQRTSRGGADASLSTSAVESGSTTSRTNSDDDHEIRS